MKKINRYAIQHLVENIMNGKRSIETEFGVCTKNDLYDHICTTINENCQIEITVDGGVAYDDYVAPDGIELDINIIDKDNEEE